MTEKEKAVLNCVKQFCDFIMDETGTVEFRQTGEECLDMIHSLTALKLTAEMMLRDKILESLQK